MGIKACWADETELPGECSIDLGEIYNCIHAKNLKRKEDCNHWDVSLSLQLCKEILGDKYVITRTT